MVDNTGRVAFIHKLNDNHVITITQNGVILIWHVENTIWWTISKREIPNPANTHISFSCLSHMRTYLAVLNARTDQSHELFLLNFHENNAITPTRIETSFYFMHTFKQKMTCCDISQDEHYIAVGFETGLISVSVFHDRC